MIYARTYHPPNTPLSKKAVSSKSKRLFRWNKHTKLGLTRFCIWFWCRCCATFTFRFVSRRSFADAFWFIGGCFFDVFNAFVFAHFFWFLVSHDWRGRYEEWFHTIKIRYLNGKNCIVFKICWFIDTFKNEFTKNTYFSNALLSPLSPFLRLPPHSVFSFSEKISKAKGRWKSLKSFYMYPNNLINTLVYLPVRLKCGWLARRR